jgi:alpha-ketoglutarate-dependent taurine dioxygenase
MNMLELAAKGWTLIDGITSKEDLLQLGRTLGSPVRTPNGELVKEIRKLPAKEAPPGSQSAKYGSGPFPLHTDTVFWPTPIRYVVLRGYGDTRRPTTVMPFHDMIADCGPRVRVHLQEAVFLVTAGRIRFYCSLQFHCGDFAGWRYDADLMTPVNPAAIDAHNVLRELVTREDVHPIHWSGHHAAVFMNWSTLHGRGKQPIDEGVRVIERLYVR